jgi:2-phospho-L-lactate/phosphoenolpyruvate guanylyltransferase
MNAVVIMLKPVEMGKTRLRTCLSDTDRHALIYSMLEDVQSAVLRAQLADQVWVATKDPVAGEIGRNRGVTVFDEGHMNGLNAAVKRGAMSCLEQGIDHYLVLPADIPLVSPEDVDFLLQTNPGTASCVKIVPSADGAGTNALFLSPPNVISPSFGINSSHVHARSAREKGIPCHIVQNRRISVDVDRPDDLLYIARYGNGTMTAQYLIESGLLDRLSTLENPFQDITNHDEVTS